MDSSGSIRQSNPSDGSYDNWALLLEFVVDIVRALDIGLDDTRVGLVRFGDEAANMFYLNSYTDKADVIRSIRSTQFLSQNTNTSGGIRVMHEEQFTEDNGDRDDVPNIAVVITDGRSTIDRDRTISDAEAARDDGIRIYSVGITEGVDEDELKEMSSEPQEEYENYFMSTDFTVLNQVVDLLVAQTCQSTVDCSGAAMDVVIAMDTSDSISNNDFGRMRSFVRDLVEFWDIGPNFVRVGIVRFGRRADNLFYLDTFDDADDLDDAIKDIDHLEESQRNISGAIRATHYEQFLFDNGDRFGVEDVFIIITDGEATLDAGRTESDAINAREDGIRIYAIGVTDSVNEDDLKIISSEPQILGRNYWMSPRFSALSDIQEEVAQEGCKASGIGEYIALSDFNCLPEYYTYEAYY